MWMRHTISLFSLFLHSIYYEKAIVTPPCCIKLWTRSNQSKSKKFVHTYITFHGQICKTIAMSWSTNYVGLYICCCFVFILSVTLSVFNHIRGSISKMIMNQPDGTPTPHKMARTSGSLCCIMPVVKLCHQNNTFLFCWPLNHHPL